jgi:hypothetical protein
MDRLTSPSGATAVPMARRNRISQVFRPTNISAAAPTRSDWRSMRQVVASGVFRLFWARNQADESARLGLALVETHPILTLNEAETGAAPEARASNRAPPEGPGKGWSALFAS